MLLNRLREYPNHFIENGILYRGEKTRRVVKVDENGFCNIKYKNITVRTKIESLATVKVDLSDKSIVDTTKPIDIDRYLIYTAIKQYQFQFHQLHLRCLY